MTFSTLRIWPLALGISLTLAAGTAQAVALNPPPAGSPFWAETALPGTTVAARPELAGTVLEDVSQAFSFGNVSGTVQNRVVRSTTLGTLDFYWRIVVDGSPGTAAPGQVTVFRLLDFGFADLTDADWRIDGLPLTNQASPDTARLYTPLGSRSGGAINFYFTNTPVKRDNESTFFFLHTDATAYAKTATYDLGCGGSCLSGLFGTFAPAVPEPSTYAMLAPGLALTGFVAGRRKRR